MVETKNDSLINDAGLPVDYSFKNAVQFADIAIEGPRTTRMGKIPERGEKRKYLTRSIWVNNNKLIDIKGIDNFVEKVLEQPERIGWIDFSFNNITEIDQSILKFDQLKILYFHGNNIESIDELIKLKQLKKLRVATFHGNPICDHPNYRSLVLAFLPQIVKLDFTPILKEDRLEPVPAEAHRRLRLYEETEMRKAKDKTTS